METLLQIEGLKTHFFKREGIVKAVDGVDLDIKSGKTMALVGESGSGKSITALSILRLVPAPGRTVSGTVAYRGSDLMGLSEKEMSMIRGREIGLILQDPAASLNPVMRVGEQVSEVIRTHFRIRRSEARDRAMGLMEKVQLPNVSRLYDGYPHQLSGGLKQRALIAAALACQPALLIADEPTTALDVSIQSQILILLKELKDVFRLSLLLISHDLSIVHEMADRIAVMYAGRVVEEAAMKDLFQKPVHPYTRALLNAVPKIAFSDHDGLSGIEPMQGAVPDLMHLPEGCAFYPRCPYQDERCRRAYPDKVFLDDDRYAACFKANDFQS